MKQKIILFLSVMLLAWSCNKDPKPEKHYDNRLTDFKILLADNSKSGMKQDALVELRNGRVVYVTVDEGTDVTSLVPFIKSGDDASFYIDGKPIDPSKTGADFTNTVELKIVTPQGDERAYHICLKQGIQQIDKQVYDIMVTYDIPGISLSANKDEKLVYSSGYGFANTDTKERVTSKHLFRLASITKTQTAIAIMKLVEEGKIKLSDRLFGKGGIFEKDFGTNLVPGADQVTIQNMLEHNSGWAAEHIFSTSGDLSGDAMNRMNYVLHNVQLKYNPGEKYYYYNMGFAMLGKVIERVTGKDYEKYMREDVYAKMGVKDIWVGKSYDGRRNNECVYYSQDGRDGYGNDMDLIKSLGGLIASSDELMRVMASVDYGTNVPDFLLPSTLDLMYTPSKSYKHYALGWRTNHTIYESLNAYHGGNLAGTGTFWSRDAETSNAAVILCNSRSYADGFDVALMEVVDNTIAYFSNLK